MKYIRFKGSTPYPHTSYIQEAVFDDDTPDDVIQLTAKGLAIDNANRHAWMMESDILDDCLRNLRYQDYVSACIDLSSIEYIEPSESNLT